MSLATCYLQVAHHVIPSYVWKGCGLDDGSKGTLYACSLEFRATFVDAVNILEFPIEATWGSLSEKSTHITSETLGQDRMSWLHKPPKCALILATTPMCSTSQKLHFHLFVPSALWLPITVT
jgi:hypothetical protein